MAMVMDIEIIKVWQRIGDYRNMYDISIVVTSKIQERPNGPLKLSQQIIIVNYLNYKHNGKEEK